MPVTFPTRVARLLLPVAVLTAFSAAAQRVPAFPGAEGAGKFSSGGRGAAATPTRVFEVTSLLDTNTAGTLRYALSQSVPHRTVVFRVCGTIHLTSRLNVPRNTTLAGQTAPGDGICLADRPVVLNGDNVIVRFMRFRLGDRYQQILDANGNPVNGSGGDDAFGGTGYKNIIVDHCTMSWSNDEALSVYGGDSTTLQWNLISEPLNYSYHFETGATDYQRHGFGGIWGGRRASFHHNLFAHCQGRNPRFDGSLNLAPGTPGLENCDFRNNVIYNWGSYTIDGGAGGRYNIVNNYFKPGPSTSNSLKFGVSRRNQIIQPDAPTASLPYGRFYLSGNYMDGAPAVTARNWLGASLPGGLTDSTQAKAAAPFVIEPLPTQSAQDAYNSVLQNVGCVLPARDPLDQRIISDVRNRTGTIIDVQGGFMHGTPYAQTTGAWPALTCGSPPADNDHDGMADSWETSIGLDPTNPADRQQIAPNGYTNLENYLNGLVAAALPARKAQGAAPLLEAYPNPAGPELRVSHPAAPTVADLSLYGSDGRLLRQQQAAPGTALSTLDLRGLPVGCYLLRYAADGRQHSTRVLVE